MALEKITVVDRLEVGEDNSVSVRRATYIEEDGVRIAGPDYRRVVYISSDDISGEELKVRAICQMAWYPEIFEAVQVFLQMTTEQQAALRAMLGLDPL